MRAAVAAIVLLLGGLAPGYFFPSRTAAAPAGEGVCDRALNMHEHAVAALAEVTSSETEEECGADSPCFSPAEFSAPVVAGEHRGWRNASPREILRTVHRLRI